MLIDFLTNDKPATKLSLRQWLMISCCFSILLVFARLIATGYATYLSLIWNLFLAFVPWLISERLARNVQIIENKWKRTLVLFIWLLFIPNTFYIITDIFHLDQFDAAPKWFDLLLLFSFAWNGLLFGILSIRRVEMILTIVSKRGFSLLFVGIVMWLNAFGIYVGRYLRYNSWDIILQPFSLFQEIFQVLFHPLQHKMQWGMISTWAIFMTLFYITIKKLAENK
jgi:uncharacterized membrane protein